MSAAQDDDFALPEQQSRIDDTAGVPLRAPHAVWAKRAPGNRGSHLELLNNKPTSGGDVTTPAAAPAAGATGDAINDAATHSNTTGQDLVHVNCVFAYLLCLLDCCNCVI